MKSSLLLLAAAILPLAVPSARAFTYQGALQDASGTPLKGNRTVEFRIYSLPEGGFPLWGRANNVLLDDNGLFNAEVADSTGSALTGVPSSGLAGVLAANAAAPLYLGLTIDNTSGEIAPRQVLLPVPYADFALDASRASGNLSVAGTAAAANATIAGLASAGSLDVAGAASVGGNLAVSGTVSGYGTAPKGCIVLWSGSADQIPSGWALCNGQNGTPDLRNRFVVGAGDRYSFGEQGGAAYVRLTERQIPAHRHLYAGDDQVANIGNSIYDAGDNVHTIPGGYDASSSLTGSGTIYLTSCAGGGEEHENRPPFYALCYIMRIK